VSPRVAGADAKRWLVLTLIGGALLALTGFVGVGTLVVTAKPERLALGAEQSFGFFDPHLHLSVVDAQTIDATGDADPDLRGFYHVVTVRVRSDAAVVDVRPVGLDVRLLDGAGRAHAPLDPAAGPHPELPGLATEFGGVVAPGESYTQTFLFRLESADPEARVRIAPELLLLRLIPDQSNRMLTRRYTFDLGRADH
jgi:hypothetical protein